MDQQEIVVSEMVRNKVVALGEEGWKWLAGLGNLVEEIEKDWQLEVGESLTGGSEAFVARATLVDGSQAILKVAMPPAEGNTVFASEIIGLKLANGRGYVRLLRSDMTRRALLLEALGPSLQVLGLSSRSQIEIICATLLESWVRVPVDTGLFNEEKAAHWHTKFIGGLWQELGKPCSRLAFETALRFTENRARAYDPATAVLVHGDAHSGNTLQTLSQVAGTMPSFKLIDPDGLFAQPACDLGVLMRDWLDELLPDPLKLGLERRDLLCHLTGADPQAVWEWGFIQTMSTGLLMLRIGAEDQGRKMLQVVEAWAGA
jgi:streptomycin 6-kinase